jgi:hypothetical protein
MQPDVLHTNTLEILADPPHDIWRAGDLLVSFRHLDAIAVIRPDEGKVVWHWGPGVVSGQHQPRALPNGNILLFDNGVRTKHSRVIEVDPRTGKIVWSYDGAPADAFYSDSMSGCQPLADGNVLVVDSVHGRALEVTREGEIVWEYLNPFRADDERLGRTPKARLIGTMYRMERHPAAVLEAITP